MIPVVLIGGTGSLYRNDWWKRDSAFSSYLRTRGIEHLKPEEFRWSTDLNGVNLRDYFSKKDRKHSDWEAGGYSLKYYLEDTPEKDRNIISHSHARQVVIYALFHGLKINSWIDVSGPIRDDLAEKTDAILHRVLYATHIYSFLDWIQILGALFDGNPLMRSECPISTNIKLPHSFGHSELLCNPDKFSTFEELHILDTLRWGRGT